MNEWDLVALESSRLSMVGIKDSLLNLSNRNKRWIEIGCESDFVSVMCIKSYLILGKTW